MRLLKSVLIGASVLVIVLLGWFVSDVRFLVEEKTSHELRMACKERYFKKYPEKNHRDMSEEGYCDYGWSYWYCTYLGVRGETLLRFDERKYTQCPNVRFGPTKS
jgi:hypothetical protein